MMCSVMTLFFFGPTGLAVVLEPAAALGQCEVVLVPFVSVTGGCDCALLLGQHAGAQAGAGKLSTLNRRSFCMFVDSLSESLEC